MAAAAVKLGCETGRQCQGRTPVVPLSMWLQLPPCEIGIVQSWCHTCCGADKRLASPCVKMAAAAAVLDNDYVPYVEVVGGIGHSLRSLTPLLNVSHRSRHFFRLELERSNAAARQRFARLMCARCFPLPWARPAPDVGLARGASPPGSNSLHTLPATH